jgi:hypothetical protein
MASESTTRKEVIDLRLKDAGWNVSDRTQVIEEYFVSQSSGSVVREDPTPYGSEREFSDYVLLGKNGKPLAVVEAKRSSKDAEIGREQAKQYCLNIQIEQGGELPFCFYTNGHEIFFWNLGEAPPQKVHGFPTRQDLERLLYIRKHKKPLTDELINTAIAGRDYQLQAIRSVMEGIAKNRRQFLLVMATGTGKTRTCIALVDALMRAACVQRVLFLVDRIALRGQALDAFKEHIPDEPRWPEPGEKTITADRRIYVATYPTMLNVVRDNDNALSPHFFDLVVIDESHRSIYNTYGEVLDYFHAIKLGLTATPRDVIDHNTFAVFNCEDDVTKAELYHSGSLYVNETISIPASHERIMRFKEGELMKDGVTETLYVKGLSDGEHQLLHTIGLCLLYRHESALFLLDEPETHLNPDWRASYISTLRAALEADESTRKVTREVLLTSHSPFIISDCRKENVLVFTKDPATRRVTWETPGFETFGASANAITIKVFGQIETIGDYAMEKIIALRQRLEAGEDPDQLVKEAGNELGDSVEKVLFVNQALNKRQGS